MIIMLLAFFLLILHHRSSILQLVPVLLQYLRDNHILQFGCLHLGRLACFLAQDQLEPIFDLGLSAALDQVGDVAPFVAELLPDLEEGDVFLDVPLALVDRGVESGEPSFATLLAVPLGEGVEVLLFFGQVVEELADLHEELVGEVGPVLGALLDDELFEDLVLLVGPLGLVASDLLDEEPPLLALLPVLGGYDLGHLFPVVAGEVLDIHVVLDDVGKQPVLEQVRLVLLPLSLRPLALVGVLLFLQQLFVDLHGLLIRDDAIAEELVLAVLESDNVVVAHFDLAGLLCFRTFGRWGELTLVVGLRVDVALAFNLRNQLVQELVRALDHLA